LDKIIRKIDRTGTSNRLPGSGLPHTAQTADKIEEVETLVLSQEVLPQTNRAQRQIAREVSISQRSVNRIVKKDLRLIMQLCMKKHRSHELTMGNKQARLDRSRLLLRRYSASLMHFIWFTDEKLFTVASPNNTRNDRLYVVVGTLKRYNAAADRPLSTRPTFSKFLMVSVGVSFQTFSKFLMVSVGVSFLGRTSIYFDEPR